MAPVPAKALREYERRVRKLAEQLANGEITPDVWHEEMRRLVGGLHVAAFMAGVNVDDTNDLSDEAAAVLAAILASQLGYLARWFGQVRDGGIASAKKLAARAMLYASAANHTFTRAQADTRGLPPLGRYPGDGKTRCGVNCRCRLRVVKLDGERNYDVTWLVNVAAEHCVDCVRLSREWNPLRVRSGVIA